MPAVSPEKELESGTELPSRRGAVAWVLEMLGLGVFLFGVALAKLGIKILSLPDGVEERDKNHS